MSAQHPSVTLGANLGVWSLHLPERNAWRRWRWRGTGDCADCAAIADCTAFKISVAMLAMRAICAIEKKRNQTAIRTNKNKRINNRVCSLRPHGGTAGAHEGAAVRRVWSVACVPGQHCACVRWILIIYIIFLFWLRNPVAMLAMCAIRAIGAISAISALSAISAIAGSTPSPPTPRVGFG